MIGWYRAGLLLGFAIGIQLGFVLGLVATAHAASLNVCEPYSREAVRIAVAGGTPKFRDVTPDQIRQWYERVLAACIVDDEPPLLPTALPGGSLDAWIETTSRLVVSNQGTAPASAEPDEDRAKRCRRAYRTFRASDMTVIRYGSKGRRVPCPL